VKGEEEGREKGGEKERVKREGGGGCFIMADYYVANQVKVWFHTTGPAALTVGVFFYPLCTHIHI